MRLASRRPINIQVTALSCLYSCCYIMPCSYPAIASLDVSVDWVDNKTLTDECQASVRCVPFVIHFVMIIHGRHPRPTERVCNEGHLRYAPRNVRPRWYGAEGNTHSQLAKRTSHCAMQPVVHIEKRSSGHLVAQVVTQPLNTEFLPLD